MSFQYHSRFYSPKKNFPFRGLSAANNLITAANRANDRKQYKKLIVLFTSNYSSVSWSCLLIHFYISRFKNQRPDVLALSIRQSGIDISTVYTGAGTSGNTAFQLKFVGNYNMNFHMQDAAPIVQELQGATAMGRHHKLGHLRRVFFQQTVSVVTVGVNMSGRSILEIFLESAWEI